MYPHFIDAARCDHIIALARAKLRSSDLAWRPDEKPDDSQVGGRLAGASRRALGRAVAFLGRRPSKARKAHCVPARPGSLQGAPSPRPPPPRPQDMRTSEGTFIDSRDDKDGVLAWLEHKIAAVTLLPVQHGEVC